MRIKLSNLLLVYTYIVVAMLAAAFFYHYKLDGFIAYGYAIWILILAQGFYKMVRGIRYETNASKDDRADSA